MRLGFYAVQPIPGKPIFAEASAAAVEMIIVGAIFGAIYKPASVRSS